jgi:selenide,water dikinase
MASGDDAGVYALGDGRALVQTVDIFTPVVDSPVDWGRIAAVNALSDIYAMGAEPVTALQYLAWPRDELPFELATEVISAGLDVMSEAGCTVVGGHSIDGPEPTYGFAVTGLAPVDGVVTNVGAHDGDVLILTKPLGMGIITTAIKRGRCPADLAASAVEVMTERNDVAGAALRAHSAHAATDVTGFGLLGHLREMCQASGVGATVELESVPVLEGVSDLLGAGMWAGGSQRNLESLGEDLASDIDIERLKPLMDAQTSGGLLVALAEASAPGYLSAVPGAVRVGRITSDKLIRVT